MIKLELLFAFVIGRKHYGKYWHGKRLSGIKCGIYRALFRIFKKWV